MAASSMALKMVCVVMACMVVAAPFAQVEAAITCGVVISKLTPCLTYLQGKAPKPSLPCCGGVKALNAAASSTPDRQAACSCLKSAATNLKVNLGAASSLPGICGVSIPYKISPSTDCTKVK